LELLRLQGPGNRYSAGHVCYGPWSARSCTFCVDLFLYDIKSLDDDKHRVLTGVSNRTILENLRALCEHGHPIILRVPVIPGINDGVDEIRAIGALAADLPSVRRVELLPYHRIGVEKYGRIARAYSLPDVQPPSTEKIAAISRIFQQDFGLLVEVS
jgi:pyruvate formate lyase activating enzyme